MQLLPRNIFKRKKLLPVEIYSEKYHLKQANVTLMCKKCHNKPCLFDTHTVHFMRKSTTLTGAVAAATIKTLFLSLFFFLFRFLMHFFGCYAASQTKTPHTLTFIVPPSSLKSTAGKSSNKTQKCKLCKSSCPCLFVFFLFPPFLSAFLSKSVFCKYTLEVVLVKIQPCEEKGKSRSGINMHLSDCLGLK